MSTYKQTKLIKAIASGECTTLAEAGRKAGYSTTAHNIYRSDTKKHIEKALESSDMSKEGIKRQFSALKELAIAKEDLSNANRALENIARIAGLMKEGEQKVNIALFDGIAEELRRVNIGKSE